MTECVVVDGLPVAADKGTDKQQKGRLRLVEIGDQLVHYMEGLTGLDHNLRLCVQGLLTGLVHPIQQ